MNTLEKLKALDKARSREPWHNGPIQMEDGSWCAAGPCHLSTDWDLDIGDAEIDQRFIASLANSAGDLLAVVSAAKNLSKNGCYCHEKHNHDPTMKVGNHTGPCHDLNKALAPFTKEVPE